MVYPATKTRKVILVQVQQQSSDEPEPGRYYVEYVEVSTDEAAANG